MRYIAVVTIFRSLAVMTGCIGLAGVLAMGEGQTGPGTYSRQAVDLWSNVAGSPQSFEVLSPDKRSAVRAKYVEDLDEKIVLNVSGAIGVIDVDIGHGVNSELLWSPDSKSFFVTTSDQGGNGSYRLIVVGRFGDKLVSRDMTSLIYKQFGHPVRCGWPEAPNVGGITWLGQTGHILVAAEIVAHSNCDSYGTFKSYEVDPASMKVVRSYGQLETKRRFGKLLGEELINAPDECIRNPRSCYVPINHPTK